jgi:hypothetical protein
MRYLYIAPIKTEAEKRESRKLPRLAKASLSKLIKDRVETKVITPGSAAAGQARRVAQAKTVNADLSTAFKGRKSILQRLLKLTEAERKKTPVRNHKRTGRRFMLLSAEAALQDAYGINLMRSNRSVCARNFDALKTLFDKSSAPLSPALKSRVDKLSNLQGLGSAEIIARQADLVRVWVDNLAARLLTDADLTHPGSELGEGGKGDQSGADPCAGEAANPKGLIKLHRWPLKGHITSIKNQGNRGTCSAFGTVAAVEAAISVKYGRKLNLSEQDLYKKQRLDWNPNLLDSYNEDGYFPLVSMLFQLVTGYVFAYEKDWEYNPSMSRNPSGDGPWTMSCVGYNGLACSDTNHQADRKEYVISTTEVREVVNEVCDYIEPIPFIGLIGGWVCDRTTEFIDFVSEVKITVYETDVPGNSRYKASQWVPVWDPIWDSDIAAAKVLLSTRVPLIFCFVVPDSWDDGAHNGPNGMGYIVYNPSEAAPSDAGSHCVALMGHIDNSDIPAEWHLEPGAGGGYFIVKNSWGVCWADRGYAYAPYDWVRKWGTSILAITQVERV